MIYLVQYIDKLLPENPDTEAQISLPCDGLGMGIEQAEIHYLSHGEKKQPDLNWTFVSSTEMIACLCDGSIYRVKGHEPLHG